MTTMSSESSVVLREYGLEGAVVSNQNEIWDFVIEILWDDEIDEIIHINNMFGYELPAYKLFHYHKRQVENGNADKITVLVRDRENGIIYQDTTLFPEEIRRL